MVKGQVHEKFKTFKGSSLTGLGVDANLFLQEGKYAAKSIAVVADPKGFVMSLGYREDEPHYMVSVVDVSLVKVSSYALPVEDQIDTAITSAADAPFVGDVICHSLYSANGELHVVFLVHVGTDVQS